MSRAFRALLGSILAVLAVWSMASSPAAALSLPVPSGDAYDAPSCCVDAASSHGDRGPPSDAAQLQPRPTAETDADAVPTRPDDPANPQAYAYDLMSTQVPLTSVETDTTSGSTGDLGGSTGSAIASAPLQVAAKSADEGVDLFRHVGPDELADIGSNGFRQGPNSLGGKWFAESEGNARQWGAWLNPDGGSVVRVRIPRDLADGLRREAGKYDGIGPARYVDQDQLGILNRLMQWDVLP